MSKSIKNTLNIESTLIIRNQKIVAAEKRALRAKRDELIRVALEHRKAKTEQIKKAPLLAKKLIAKPRWALAKDFKRYRYAYRRKIFGPAP